MGVRLQRGRDRVRLHRNVNTFFLASDFQKCKHVFRVGLFNIFLRKTLPFVPRQAHRCWGARDGSLIPPTSIAPPHTAAKHPPSRGCPGLTGGGCGRVGFKTQSTVQCGHRRSQKDREHGQPQATFRPELMSSLIRLLHPPRSRRLTKAAGPRAPAPGSPTCGVGHPVQPGHGRCSAHSLMCPGLLSDAIVPRGPLTPTSCKVSPPALSICDYLAPGFSDVTFRSMHYGFSPRST